MLAFKGERFEAYQICSQLMVGLRMATVGKTPVASPLKYGIYMDCKLSTHEARQWYGNKLALWKEKKVGGALVYNVHQFMV